MRGLILVCLVCYCSGNYCKNMRLRGELYKTKRSIFQDLQSRHDDNRHLLLTTFHFPRLSSYRPDVERFLLTSVRRAHIETVQSPKICGVAHFIHLMLQKYYQHCEVGLALYLAGLEDDGISPKEHKAYIFAYKIYIDDFFADFMDHVEEIFNSADIDDDWDQNDKLAHLMGAIELVLQKEKYLMDLPQDARHKIAYLGAFLSEINYGVPKY